MSPIATARQLTDENCSDVCMGYFVRLIPGVTIIELRGRFVKVFYELVYRNHSVDDRRSTRQGGEIHAGAFPSKPTTRVSVIIYGRSS